MFSKYQKEKFDLLDSVASFPRFVNSNVAVISSHFFKFLSFIFYSYFYQIQKRKIKNFIFVKIKNAEDFIFYFVSSSNIKIPKKK